MNANIYALSLQGDWLVLATTLLICLVGALLYPALQMARQRGWCGYEDTTPTEFKVSIWFQICGSFSESGRGGVLFGVRLLVQ